MKPWMGSLVRVETQRLWSAAVVGCLLIPLVFLAVLRQSSQPLSIMNLQVSIVHSHEPALLDGVTGVGGSQRRPKPNVDDQALPPIRDTSISQPGGVQKRIQEVTEEENRVEKPAQEVTEDENGVEEPTPRAATEKESSGDGSSGSGPALPVQHANSSQQTGDDQPAPPAQDAGSASTSSSPQNDGDPTSSSENENSSQKPGTRPQESRIMCDLSQIRTDFCDLYGDVRIDGSTSSVVLATPSTPETPAGNSSWKIRPYARKWEVALMPQIKEFSVRTAAADAEGTLRCTVNHSVPGIVFSTGGLLGNFFHDIADVLIPLFLTSYRYNGEVQFLLTQHRASWVDKYQAVLRQLSRYDLINLDTDAGVHCFPQATVGLLSNMELGIDPAKPPGYSMVDFRRLLRSSYSLKREYPLGRGTGKKPRLLYLSRRGSRTLLNERKVLRLARSLGFKVVVATPEAARNLPQFARTVNSCDVLMGVHGAGLTNMLFLPTNATMLQVVPWGELKYPCRFSYGDPAVGMGLRYLEYEVGKEESSLIKQYPKNHPVLTDPLSIHRQGFPAVWSIFIDKQNVTIDLGRFRPVLLEALNTYAR